MRLAAMWRLTAMAVAIVCPFLAGTLDATAQSEPVRLGVLNDQSGPFADITGMGSVVAAQMAVEDFGCILLGRKVVGVAAYHQNKPDIGAAIARQWLDQDGVQAIIDVPNSAVMLAVQDVVRNKSGVMLVAGAAAARFNGAPCHPYGFQWVYDTYALAKAAGTAITQTVGKSWYFIQADYAFGEAMTADLQRFIQAAGGRVVGTVKHPVNTADFSSYLLRAQSSKADIVAVVNAGADTINSLKQAGDFAIASGDQKLATALLYLSDARALGLELGQGLIIADGYYWDVSPEARAFAERFAARYKGRKPTSIHIGTYSAVSHYLKAARAAGTLDRDAVTNKMREMPVNDPFVKNGLVRKDGLMIHDLLLLQVKKPSESKGEWDLFKVLQTIPGASAYRPLDQSECPLTKG